MVDRINYIWTLEEHSQMCLQMTLLYHKYWYYIYMDFFIVKWHYIFQKDTPMKSSSVSTAGHGLVTGIFFYEEKNCHHHVYNQIFPPHPSQVLDISSTVMMTVPSPPAQPASAYKIAVDHFIQNDGCSRLTLQEQEETSLPEVEESKTLLLQQMMASAKTLTAREDLLNTLRLDGGAELSCLSSHTVHTEKYLSSTQGFNLALPHLLKHNIIQPVWCQSLFSSQRQHLLVHTARTKGYSKLMLGDNCTRVAVKLLTSISLGRGAQLAQDTVRVFS